MRQCVDKVVGDILAGWRYDISGLVPDMAVDYERHFAECERCRAKRHLHRTIDIALIALATVSAFVFVLAFVVIHRLAPRHALYMEIAALGGFLLSALVWLLVLVATPAPMVMIDAARTGARRVHDRLPEELRNRIPEELRLKISGQ
jgi:hypothetical protein